jgi:hypothetical protein
VLAVEVLRMALSHALHEPRRAEAIVGRHEQMDVVGHQHVSVDSAVEFGRQLFH